MLDATSSTTVRQAPPRPPPLPLAAADQGQAGREVMSAVLDGDIAGVERRLAVDKALVATRGGPNGDRLNLAIARWRSSFATLTADHPDEARLRRSACN